MSDPPGRAGLFLSGMSWFCEIKTKSGLIPRERQARRPAAQDAKPQTNSGAMSRPKVRV